MTGGKKRGRTQRKHFNKNRENVWKFNKKDKPDETGAVVCDDADTVSNSIPHANTTWQPFSTQNQAFELYYKAQCIVPVEEWDVFINVLRNPLPSAFRINSSGQFFKDIRAQLEEDFAKTLKSDTTNEYEVKAIRPLPWYPENLAWHLNFSRMELRKNQMLERFHEFLKQENEIGNITRQEAVSMVPPLFLDVLPHHHVLDMCAAPGSKTFQLLELMNNSTEIGEVPYGMVIANDVDVQRCNLLIHQTKRMCCANLIVTNHEAQQFPSCHLNSNALDSTASCEGRKKEKHRQLLFDRVLCDVPCSGDGTLRKAPDIWRKWHAGMGNGLYSLQVQIALRGLALLTVGGRMVYSTCSMNPVENEAVVSEILSRCGESVELLDVSTEIPELIRRPGLRTWKVRDKGLWLSSYSDVPAHRRSTILQSMFPAGRIFEVPFDDVNDNTVKTNLNLRGTNCANQDVEDSNISIIDANHDCNGEVSSFPLERCMRILPHDQNSGAFFIAVLRKKCHLPAIAAVSNKIHSHSRDIRNGGKEKTGLSEDNCADVKISENIEESTKLDSSDAKMPDTPLNEVTYENVEYIKSVNILKDGDREKKDKGKIQMQSKWRGIDPVVFFEDGTSIDSIKSFYGISQSFQLDGHLVCRNYDVNHVKRIYYISKSVQEVLKLNFEVGQRLKIASLGLKLFERQSLKDGSTCTFRISSEGLLLILPYITKQILFTPLIDFCHLLQNRNIKFTEFINADFSEKATKLLLGCCIVVLTNKENEVSDTDEQKIAIVCWKGKNSLSVLVSETDGQELLQRLAARFGIEKPTPSKSDSAAKHDIETLQHVAEQKEKTEDGVQH